MNVLRLESRKLLRETTLLTAAFALLSVLFLVVFPSMAEEAELIEDAFPEQFTTLFGFEAMHTLEGFLGSYVFSFVWVVFFGVYCAYVGGGMIAPDVRDRRIDLTLSTPVSRESVLLQNVGAIWLPLVVLNVVLFVVLFGGSIVLDASIDPTVLAAAHILSIPYLLVCTSIGVVFSVVLDRPNSARMGALGVVFLLWLVDGISEMDDSFEWIGAFTPSRYYDPAAILIHEKYALGDTGVLLLATGGLLALATYRFTRRDL